MQCPIHPDLPAMYKCEKYMVSMCKRCMRCRSPKVHCGARQHCLIWRLTEEKFEADEANGGEAGAGEQIEKQL
jgi:hypothetical protein